MTFLKSLITQQLISKGYLDQEIEYSLGYCQGDGVAWSGNLSLEALGLLMDRLLKSEATEQERQRMLQVLGDYRRHEKVSIYRNSTHYCHELTMSLDNTVDFGCLLDEDDMAKEGVSQEMITRWSSLWDSFILKLGRDIRCGSRHIAKMCYALMESCSSEVRDVVVKKTKNFTVILRERPADIEELEWIFLDDNAFNSDQFKSLIAAKSRFVCLEAIVLQSEQGWLKESVLGHSVVSVVVDSDDCTYAGKRNYVLSCAIDSARTRIARCLEVYGQFNKAA